MNESHPHVSAGNEHESLLKKLRFTLQVMKRAKADAKLGKSGLMSIWDQDVAGVEEAIKVLDSGATTASRGDGATNATQPVVSPNLTGDVAQAVWMPITTAPKGPTISVARKGGQRDDGSTYWYQAIGHYDPNLGHFHKSYGELYGEPEVWAHYPENPEHCAAQPGAPVVPSEVMERRRKGLSDYEKPPLGQPPSWLQEQEKIAAPHNGSSAATTDDTDHIDWDVLAEERLGQRPIEHGRHIPQTSPAPGCDSGSHSAVTNEPQAAQEWQPIATKPPWQKCEERGLYTDNGDELFYFKATHWRPLSPSASDASTPDQSRNG